ncbi:gamma-tubulin complex component 4 isoform X2 [Ischnura elegans]|uniref:gamma-tubulin complex component 4 isoform X2 n=1 Tax=Ischnura elegans TaxID=197161 RepID=UPI001ED86753|nr:gamma-tubulin complex component 4 isoform X2 [Ischnura elegans]
MLHEVLLALSGFPGSLFVEYDNRIQVADSVTYILDSDKTLLNRILCVASEYKALKSFVESQNNLYYATLRDECNPNGSGQQCPGMYMQAFCDALMEVTEPYNQELIDLELEILSDPCLSLTHILSRVEKHSCVLQTLNSIVKEVKKNNVRGCYLLEFLYRHSKSGVVEVKEALKCIMKTCHAVFYQQLSSWLLYGQLIDFYNEFIVQNKNDLDSSMSSSTPDSDASPGNAGDDKQFSKGDQLSHFDFTIRQEMLPSYIPLSLVGKILYVGNTIVMCGNDPKENSGVQIPLHRNETSICGDKEIYFLKKICKLKEMETFSVLVLDGVVDEIKSCVTEHLWSLAMKEGQLNVQFRLMKDYFLLGRGELFNEFIHQSEFILSKPVSSSMSREINTCFAVAASKILMEDDPSIEKFQFTFSKSSDCIQEGKTAPDNGWSRLSLTYHPSWPIAILFTPAVLHNYNSLFCFLLRIKKIQMDLNSVWRDHMTLKTRGICRSNPVVWQLRNCLMFIINNLQYYLQVDVLESQYADLQATVKRSKDFDVIWKAHTKFQAQIMSQTFLFMGPEASMQGLGHIEAVSTKVGNPVHGCLLHLLSMAEIFCAETRTDAVREEGLKEQEEGAVPVEAHGSSAGSRWADAMATELERRVVFLMQLLSGLRSHPSGIHLSQLLLRLDYNGWFSQRNRRCTGITSD